jgi:hypothetical protein
MPTIGPFRLNMVPECCSSVRVRVPLLGWDCSDLIFIPILSFLYIPLYQGEAHALPTRGSALESWFPIGWFRFLPRGLSIYGHLTSWSVTMAEPDVSTWLETDTTPVSRRSSGLIPSWSYVTVIFRNFLNYNFLRAQHYPLLRWKS